MTEEEIAIYDAGFPLELQIEHLKQNLSDTDYHILKLAEGAISLVECAGIIAQRKAWRKQINEIEERIKKGE